MAKRYVHRDEHGRFAKKPSSGKPSQPSEHTGKHHKISESKGRFRATSKKTPRKRSQDKDDWDPRKDERRSK